MRILRNVSCTAGLLLAAAAIAPLPALGHGSTTPQHGGVLQMSGEMQVELVVRRATVDVYVSEEDEPLAASGFDGVLILTAADGSTSRVPLQAVAGNRFTAGMRPPSGTRVVVSLTSRASQARTFVTFRMT
jgi:hypothetical protein